MAEPATDRSTRPDLALPTVRDHLANERTLLAWLRTAITVIGLGFIIDRLAAGSGDGLVPQIAASSIIAKTCRDLIMARLSTRHGAPGAP